MSLPGGGPHELRTVRLQRLGAHGSPAQCARIHVSVSPQATASLTSEIWNPSAVAFQCFSTPLGLVNIKVECSDVVAMRLHDRMSRAQTSGSVSEVSNDILVLGLGGEEGLDLR